MTTTPFTTIRSNVKSAVEEVVYVYYNKRPAGYRVPCAVMNQSYSESETDAIGDNIQDAKTGTKYDFMIQLDLFERNQELLDTLTDNVTQKIYSKDAIFKALDIENWNVARCFDAPDDEEKYFRKILELKFIVYYTTT